VGVRTCQGGPGCVSMPLHRRQGWGLLRERWAELGRPTLRPKVRVEIYPYSWTKLREQSRNLLKRWAVSLLLSEMETGMDGTPSCSLTHISRLPSLSLSLISLPPSPRRWRWTWTAPPSNSTGLPPPPASSPSSDPTPPARLPRLSPLLARHRYGIVSSRIPIRSRVQPPETTGRASVNKGARAHSTRLQKRPSCLTRCLE
jgi:hypothetical protein